MFLSYIWMNAERVSVREEVEGHSVQTGLKQKQKHKKWEPTLESLEWGIWRPRVSMCVQEYTFDASKQLEAAWTTHDYYYVHIITSYVKILMLVSH